MKVLVCGGSRYKGKEAIFACLDELHATTKVMLVINGGARGADSFARGEFRGQYTY